MANTVTSLSYANTFGDWVVTTNHLTDEVNDIGFNNYIKPSGTLFLNSPTLGLQVANTAIVQGQFRVIGTGSSAYIQNNLEVNAGQVYFSNTVLGLTNSGQSIFNGRINANGANVGLTVANNTTLVGYLKVSSNTALVGPTALSNTLSVFGPATMANTLGVTGAVALGNTLSVVENSTFGNNIFVTNKTNTYDFFAENFSNTASLRVRNNGSLGGSLRVDGFIINTNRLQANVYVNTASLTVVGPTYTETLSSNTSILGQTLIVIDDSYTNTLQANIRINTPTVLTENLNATSTILANTIQANTNLSTTSLLAYGSAMVNSLQSNTSVNTSTITATNTIIGREIKSNNSISANNSSISELSSANNIVANTSILTPALSVTNRIDANNALAYVGEIRTTGRISVGGDFVINGNTVYNSPFFTLSSGLNNQTSLISVYRSPGANASIRWNEIAGYWDIKDVATSQFYRILTEQQLTNSVTTVSSILGASATAANTLNNSIITLNGYLTSNVTSLQNQITSNVTSLQSQITSNSISLQSQITSNAAISQAGISASYQRANTSANVFFGTTGTGIPNSGVISFASNNGVIVSGTANTLYINTPQNIRTTDSPTFNALTLTNTLAIGSGGTGASDKNSALFNLVPTTTGVPAGYVLATGGGGGSSFYWAAGGSGGSGGATPGTTIASSRTTATGSGSTLAYNIPVYVPGQAQVRTYINGVRQLPSEYTETSGNTAGSGIITFTVAPQINDNILFEVDGYIINPYYANNIGFTVNPTIGATANTIQLAIDGLTTLAAPKASPTLTGIPVAPTAATGTSTTQLATTAFVNNTLGSGGTYAHSISGNATTTSQTNFSNLTIGGSQVVSAANYNSYAPTLTGIGASGSWNISAAQLGGLVLQTASTAPGGNQVLRSDVSGYSYFNYINSSTPNSENPTISQIIVTNGSDNFYRKSSIAAFTSAVQTNASGSWNITAAAATNATNATNGRYVYNNGAYSGSGYVEPSDLGVRYAASSGTCTTAARATRANGNLYIDDNYGNGVVGVYSASRYQGVFAMGDAYKLPADGTTVGNLYGLAWSHPNAGGAAANLDSHGLLCLINGGYASSMSYSIKASGNITAYSDERLKTNWRSLSNDFVSKLAKVKCGIYDRLDRDLGTQVGVSAQSLQEILPEAIETADDEMKTLSVHYGNAALASAVELAKEVVLLKEMMKELKAEIEVLKGNSK